MKKSFLIVAFSTLSLISCKNEKNTPESTTEETAAPAVNQDSIDKAHGHSHDPAAAPVSTEENSENAHGHSHDAPTINQDSIDKAHGHKH